MYQLPKQKQTSAGATRAHYPGRWGCHRLKPGTFSMTGRRESPEAIWAILGYELGGNGGHNRYTGSA
jgi:hypothetical protein